MTWMDDWLAANRNVILGTAVGLQVVSLLFALVGKACKSSFKKKFDKIIPLKTVVEGGTDSSGPKIVITGGSGFLGRYTIAALLKSDATKNCKIVSFDAVAARTPFPGVTYIQGDVRDQAQLEEVFSGATSIIHMAAVLPGAGLHMRHRLEEVNVKGTEKVVAAAKAAGVGSVVYLSSCTAVIDPMERNATGMLEDSELPQEGVDDYATTKIKCEALLKAADSKELRTFVVRPGACFGAGDKLCADKWAFGEDRFFIGDGDRVMPWIHAGDVARGVASLVGKVVQNKPVDGRAFNLCPDEGAEQVTYRAFNGDASTADAETGLTHWKTKPSVSLPLALVKVLAAINEYLAGEYGVAPMSTSLTMMAIDWTQRTYTYNTAKTRKALDWEPMPAIAAAKMVADGGMAPPEESI